jgi:acetylornithine deacetylase/succinyl-diaminopimelate desuccinylase-like protein
VFRADAMLLGLVDHLRRLPPMGMTLDVCGAQAPDGMAAGTTGPAYEAAIAAMSEAWRRGPVLPGTCGSVPVAAALRSAVPDAEILVFGAMDSESNSHRPDERVLIAEFEKTIVAESKFFREYAQRAGSQR